MKRKPVIKEEDLTENEKSIARTNENFYYKYIKSIENELPTAEEKSRVPELHRAVHAEDYDKLENLLTSNKIVDSTDENGWTALHVASCRCDSRAAELLLRFGADPRAKSKTGRSPLYYALRNDHVSLVKMLAEMGADVNEPILDYDLSECTTYLHRAVEINSIEMVRTLLEHGANANERDRRGNAALHSAVEFQGQTVVELLLDHGANVSEAGQLGRTALHTAISNENLVTAELLVRRGATVDAQDDEGLGPLHLAVDRRRADLATMLLGHKANPNLPGCEARRPLHYACGPTASRIGKSELERRSREVLGALLAAGPDLEAKDALGRSPVHVAVEERRADLLAALIEHGADCREEGLVQLALKRRSYSCLWLLLDHGPTGRLLDRPSIEAEPVLPGIVRHWYRLHLAGLMRDEALLARLRGSELWRGLFGGDYERRCLAELDELRRDWSEAGVTGLELLRASRPRLLELAALPAVRAFMQAMRRQCSRTCKRKPSIYYGLLERKLTASLRLALLWDDATANLDLISQHLLPAPVLARILGYLNVCDVGNLAKLRYGAFNE